MVKLLGLIFLALGKKMYSSLVNLVFAKPPLRSKISIYTYKLVYNFFFFGNFTLVTCFILLPLSQPLKKFTIIYIEIFSKCLSNSDCSLGYLQMAYTMYVQVVYTIAQVCWEYGFRGKVVIWPEVHNTV